MLLGDGAMGRVPCAWLRMDNRRRGVPLILGTPEENDEPAEDDPSAGAYDLRMAELLKELDR